MTVTPETARAISNTLVRVMRVIGSLKSHLPLAGVADLPGLDHSHFPALFTLAGEPRRVSALAEAIHSDVSTVSRQVSHLVQIGLVEKIGDPVDGRAQLLSLSPAGRQVVDAHIAQRGEWFAQLLRDWDEDDAAAFLAQLGRFSGDVEDFKAELVAGQHGQHLQHGQHGQTTHHAQTTHEPALAAAVAGSITTHHSQNQEH